LVEDTEIDVSARTRHKRPALFHKLGEVEHFRRFVFWESPNQFIQAFCKTHDQLLDRKTRTILLNSGRIPVDFSGQIARQLIKFHTSDGCSCPRQSSILSMVSSVFQPRYQNWDGKVFRACPFPTLLQNR
jgi:hypothetical protein